MMPACWIAHVTVTDPERCRGYMELAPAAFRRHGGRFLARGGSSDTLEGPEHQRHVLIEFPDLASARACWAPPEYAEARSMREGACVAQVCIVEGCSA